MKPTLDISRSWGPLIALALAACTGRIGTTPGDKAGTGAAPGGGVQGTGGSQASGGFGNVVGSGGSGQGTGANVGAGGSVAAQCDGLTARRVRRLSIREYSNVVLDLLGLTAQQETLSTLPTEPPVAGFDNQDAALFVSPDLQETISDLAAQLATEANPTTLAPCATAGGSTSCLQTFTSSFASKAYGRPLTTQELASANAVAAMGQDYATSVRLVVEMVLQSPYTLYVTELGPDTAAPSTQPVPLTPYEVASQLSFMLTGHRPDSTLLAAAQSNALVKASDLQQQVQRLLPTAQGISQLSLFIKGWLDQTDQMSDIPKDPGVYPQFTPAVATAMQQELDQFVTTQLAGGNGTLSNFLTATSTNVPAALAPIYGTDLTASGLDPKHRKGILSLPAVLTYNSSNISSGPIQRGLLVVRQLLCKNIPPPPADVLNQVALMPVDTTDTTMTTRQKFEAHLNMPSCSACHSQFDPFGFGMEDMDGIGRFRATDNGKPVDSTGMLTGTDVDGTFEGPADLSTKLAASKTAADCMVSHFFNFAQARDPGPSDQCVLQDWSNTFAQGGGRIADLVNAAVGDQRFAYRKDDRL